MTLRIYNTLTQKNEIFEPVTPGKVGIYLCGPTVYKPSHIGHAVGPIIFDTVKRYLTFKGFDVTLVVNITDVDDKLIIEARDQNCSVPELAERITQQYLDALAQFNVTGIDEMPKASEYMPQIITLCEQLIEKEHAYVSGGDVYFDVATFNEYGKLSHRKSEDQQSGTRELTGQDKRHPHDFALWKAAKPDEPDEVKFDSPWGEGRPGWHIECSAMSSALLGKTFDIHGGGMDLIFPHHENEVAQSECAHGQEYVKYWMHNGLTRFNTKKISKSDADMRQLMTKLVLVNLLSEYSGELLRFFVLSTHYRRPIEFSDNELTAKKKGLDAFYRLFERIERITGTDPYDGGASVESIRLEDDAPQSHHDFVKTVLEHRLRFLEAMDDDFNTAGGIGSLFELATSINRFAEQEKLDTSKDEAGNALLVAATQTVRSFAAILGLFERKVTEASGDDDGLTEQLMQLLIDVRAESRKTKQFALADMIRDRLAESDIMLEDRADGTGWRKTS